MSMPEIGRHSGPNNTIELDFVERVATLKPTMKLGIHHHLAGLSLSKNVSILENFGVDRCRSAVHYWVKQTDLEPRDGRRPAKIALDETVVKVNGKLHWLFAAVDPVTNVILHVGVYTTRTTVTTKLYLRELQEKLSYSDYLKPDDEFHRFSQKNEFTFPCSYCNGRKTSQSVPFRRRMTSSRTRASWSISLWK